LLPIVKFILNCFKFFIGGCAKVSAFRKVASDPRVSVDVSVLKGVFTLINLLSLLVSFGLDMNRFVDISFKTVSFKLRQMTLVSLV